MDEFEELYLPTTGDGDCFFHAACGTLDNTTKKVNVRNALELRNKYCSFLRENFLKTDNREGNLYKYLYIELADQKFTPILSEVASELSIKDEVNFDLFRKKFTDTVLNNAKIFEHYLEAFSKKDYYVSTEEIPILASLIGKPINIYYIENNKLVKSPTFDHDYSESVATDKSLTKYKFSTFNMVGEIDLYHKGVHFSQGSS